MRSLSAPFDAGTMLVDPTMRVDGRDTGVLPRVTTFTLLPGAHSPQTLDCRQRADRRFDCSDILRTRLRPVKVPLATLNETDQLFRMECGSCSSPGSFGRRRLVRSAHL